MCVFLDSMVTQVVDLHVWAFRFVRIIVNLELWSATHFQHVFTQTELPGNRSMLAYLANSNVSC